MMIALAQLPPDVFDRMSKTDARARVLKVALTQLSALRGIHGICRIAPVLVDRRPQHPQAVGLDPPLVDPVDLSMNPLGRIPARDRLGGLVAEPFGLQPFKGSSNTRLLFKSFISLFYFNIGRDFLTVLPVGFSDRCRWGFPTAFPTRQFPVEFSDRSRDWCWH